MNSKEYPLEVYDDAYYQSHISAQDRNIASYRLRIHWLDEMLNVQLNERVVDLGCGAGTVSKHLAELGAFVEAVDISTTSVDFARQRLSHLKKINFQVCDATKCSHLISGSFDKCTCVDVIEHVHDEVMAGIFCEARRLLKPGGLLYVYSPNICHWIERLKAHNLILKQDPTHIGLRRIIDVTDALKKCGFKLVRVARPVSMLPFVSILEKLCLLLPLTREIATYRICITACK